MSVTPGGAFYRTIHREHTFTARGNPMRNGNQKKPRRLRGPSSFATTLNVCVACCLMAGTVAFAQSRTVIKGGTVLTMAGETIENGIVIISGDKIEAVGRNLQTPAGATVIDATGKYVMPGIIDAMCYYGLASFPLNDDADPVTPQNRIIEAWYPYGKPNRGMVGVQKDPELLSGGVTTIYLAPGDKQVIGGQGAVVKTCGKNYDSLIVREPASVDMTIGEPAKYKEPNRKLPITRMGVVTLIRKAFLDAQEFDRAWSEYNRKSDEEKQKGAKPERDYGKEAMVKVLRREIPARIEADLTDDIRTAVRIADEYGVDLVIDSGIGAYKVRDILAQKHVPVVLGPISHPFITGGEISMTPELDALMTERNAALLSKSGVKFALATFGQGFGALGQPTQARWLLLEAALATGFGLSDEDALKAVTINAAEILGVGDRVGSLKPGKDADVIILDGPPLGLNTWVERVYIGGMLAFARGDDR